VTDLADFFRALAPEGHGRYRHEDEGPDDIPAHIRAPCCQRSSRFPSTAAGSFPGTWQGLYLFEHGRAPHQREIALHLLGE
jgi:thiamine phosphate synthase YjbQ (UPF0047 family)